MYHDVREEGKMCGKYAINFFLLQVQNLDYQFVLENKNKLCSRHDIYYWCRSSNCLEYPPFLFLLSWTILNEWFLGFIFWCALLNDTLSASVHGGVVLLQILHQYSGEHEEFFLALLGFTFQFCTGVSRSGRWILGYNGHVASTHSAGGGMLVGWLGAGEEVVAADAVID
jgi:hypothetical protein